MSYTREFTLWCDGGYCGEWVRITASTVPEARRIARKEGWRRVREECGALIDL